MLILLATIAYATRVRREMVDFSVYRTAGARAIEAAPLFRPDDGHYQFKYFPAFALAMTPFAVVPEEAAKAIWFGLSVALLIVLVRMSVRTLPGRRHSERLLAWMAVVLMAKFYLHELNLGQSNLLLGVLLVRRTGGGVEWPWRVVGSAGRRRRVRETVRTDPGALAAVCCGHQRPRGICGDVRGRIAAAGRGLRLVGQP